MKKKDRQISTMFFERKLASKNKKALLEKGRVPELPSWICNFAFRICSYQTHFSSVLPQFKVPHVADRQKNCRVRSDIEPVFWFGMVFGFESPQD